MPRVHSLIFLGIILSAPLLFSSGTELLSVQHYCLSRGYKYQESVQLNFIQVTAGRKQVRLYLTMPYVSAQGQVYFMKQGLRSGLHGQWMMDGEYQSLLDSLLQKGQAGTDLPGPDPKEDHKEQWIHTPQNSGKTNKNTETEPETPPATNKKPVQATNQSTESRQQDGFIPIDAIIIDAGHGGKDPGAIGKNGIKEKEIVFAITGYLKEYLTAEGGYSVFLTRNKDIFVTLEDRTQFAGALAKKYHPIFISIHGNMALSSKSEGVEVFSLGEKASDDQALQVEMMENEGFHSSDIKKTDALFQIIAGLLREGLQTESSRLASHIYQRLTSHTGAKKRGLKKANFYVLKYNSVPSVLVEVGFLSHPTEGKKLSTRDYQKKLARGMYLGIREFIKEYNNTRGFSQ